jgi:hypothetical protein
MDETESRMLIATTKGLGPFKPAIRMNGVLYVLDQSFDNEDEAHAFANDLCQAIDEKAFEMIIAADYVAERNP